jgi:hypothetical protein
MQWKSTARQELELAFSLITASSQLVYPGEGFRNPGTKRPQDFGTHQNIETQARQYADGRSSMKSKRTPRGSEASWRFRELEYCTVALQQDFPNITLLLQPLMFSVSDH